MAGSVEFQSSWDSPVDRITLGLELLREMEHALIKIRRNLKIAQDRKKSYANNKRNSQRVPGGRSCVSLGESQEKFLKNGNMC
jgi:hypothetical protein